MLRNADGLVQFSRKKRYEGVRFNVTRGWGPIFQKKALRRCKVQRYEGVGVQFSRKKIYEGVRFNVISVTRGRVGVQFPEKKRYVTLEWPLKCNHTLQCAVCDCIMMYSKEIHCRAQTTKMSHHYNWEPFKFYRTFFFWILDTPPPR